MNIISTISESDVTVIKTDGRIEKWNPDKIYTAVKFACKNTNINPSQVLMDLNVKLTKRIKSIDVQDNLIKSVADKISKEEPDNDIVAARLLNQKLRKIVYNKYTPNDFYTSVCNRVKKKYYDDNILKFYTEKEIRNLGNYIEYNKDEYFTYIGLMQYYKKLLIRDKSNNPIETPQEAMMLISMYIHANEKGKINKVKDFYNSLKEFQILLSTPPSVGIRTRLRMYSSCAGIMVGDSAKAIGKAFEDIYTLTINRAGIGANVGHIRGIGASIDNGRETHTGLIPILKVIEKITLSAVQPGSSRGGAATLTYPFFHYEIVNILQLKNNKGTDDNRIRQSDHSIVFNKLFMKRFWNNEDITLFYMNEVGNLYEHIGMDDFEELYKYYENKRGITKIKISAREIYRIFWTERFATGRIYKINANEFQNHSAFKIPVYNSNLCQEINLPSFEFKEYKIKIKKNFKEAMDSLIFELEESGEWFKLYEHLKYKFELPKTENFAIYKSFLAKPKDIKNGSSDEYMINFYEIFVCILSGVNLSKVGNPGEKETYNNIIKIARQITRFLDNLIDYQEYPIPAMKRGAIGRRAIGISFSGLFHYLAKGNLDYNTLEARNEVHKISEALYYGAITESIELAKERGKCHFYNDTKYSDGLLTIDTCNKNVHELTTCDYMYDWNKVREDLKLYGLRNSTLLTMVPASNSARTAGTLSGIEPSQNLVIDIEDKRIQGKMLVPECNKFSDFYNKNSMWNIDNSEYYKLIAVIQKFNDQGISLNSYKDYNKLVDKVIPYSTILLEDNTAFKYGIKSHYYNKTNSDDEYNTSKDEEACSGGGCTL